MNNDSPLKVLFLLPNLSAGGAEKLAIDLANALSSRNLEVELLVHEGVGGFSKLPKNFTLTCVHNRPFQSKDYLRNFWATFQAVKNADVVVGALEGRASWLGVLAARLRRKPFVTWIHNSWNHYRNLVPTSHLNLLKAVISQSQAVLCCSQAAWEDIRQICPASEDKMSVLANAVDVAKTQAQSQEPLPEAWSFLATTDYMVSIGRLEDQKRFKELVLAHSKVVANGEDRHIVIVGEGAQRQMLESYAKELGIADKVHLVGFHKNPHVFLKYARAFVCTSYVEGFHLGLVEAMACGNPIISYVCKGPREILGDNQFGQLVPNGDNDALAEKLQEMWAREESHQKWKQLSIKRSLDFDFPRYTDRWVSALNDLAKSSK